jgi:hypothetical protein
MRSMGVPLEPLVRLVRVVEGGENTNASKPFKKFGESMQTPCAVACQQALFGDILPRDGNVAMDHFASRLPADRPRTVCAR